MAQPLTTFVAGKTNRLKFEHIDAKSQRNITSQATAVRKFSDDRNRWESPAASLKTGQPAVQRKSPAVPPIERKEPMITAPERKGQVAQPAERKEKVAQPVETRAPFVPPRQVNINKPEKVKIPAPPIVGKQDKAEKGPPPQPDNERKDKGNVKDTSNKGQGRETPKGQGNQKKNRSD